MHDRVQGHSSLSCTSRDTHLRSVELLSAGPLKCLEILRRECCSHRCLPAERPFRHSGLLVFFYFWARHASNALAGGAARGARRR
eukprot:COSAG01_NODE_30301_length_618_cov_4.096339_1_plen_84_part_01